MLMEKITEFRIVFSGNETVEGHEAQSKTLPEYCLVAWISALQVAASPSLAMVCGSSLIVA
jgi:hypothetical protein